MMAATVVLAIVEAAMRTGRKHTAHRGSVARALPLVLLFALAAGLGTGCGARDNDAARSDGGAPAVDSGARRVTEEGLVSYVAALTVAVEDGLVGEPARLRAEEMGAPRYERSQVEAFAARLREDPEQWIRIAARIDERVKALRAAEEAPASGAAARPSR
jgi:hypothetical protein